MEIRCFRLKKGHEEECRKGAGRTRTEKGQRRELMSGAGGTKLLNEYFASVFIKEQEMEDSEIRITALCSVLNAVTVPTCIISLSPYSKLQLLFVHKLIRSYSA